MHLLLQLNLPIVCLPLSVTVLSIVSLFMLNFVILFYFIIKFLLSLLSANKDLYICHRIYAKLRIEWWQLPSFVVPVSPRPRLR